MPVSAEALFQWHTKPGAIERLMPPWQEARVVRKDPGLEVGSETHIEMKMAGIPLLWIAKHVELEEGRLFGDIQVKGPFAFWQHWHRMIPQTDTSSLLEDEVHFRTMLGLGSGFAKKKLAALFRYRHLVLHNDLEVQNSLPTRSLRIGITGSSGLIGSTLSHFLTTAGHTVIKIPRSLKDVEDLDAVVHLAGESVGQRWNAAIKKEIKRSRVEGTKKLVDKLNQLQNPPKVLVSASGSGFYGECREATEASKKGTTFLADVCEEWESAAQKFKGRAVSPRIGVVLTPKGGALGGMLKVFSKGFGGVTGDGKQMISWIALDDLIYNLYRLIVDESLEGPINMVTASCSDRTFVKELGRVIRRPTVVPYSKRFVHFLFGEMGDELMLVSQSIQPHPKLRFVYQDLEQTLKVLLGRD